MLVVGEQESGSHSADKGRGGWEEGCRTREGMKQGTACRVRGLGPLPGVSLMPTLCTATALALGAAIMCGSIQGKSLPSN